MKKFILLLILFTIYGCNKPKVVLICGDHVCINNSEAEQYFEENLVLEVKLIDKNKPEDFDLVELNLNKNLYKKKQINIFKKDKTEKEIKILTDEEKKQKKEIIKSKKNIKKTKLKNLKKNKELIKLKKTNIKKNKDIISKNKKDKRKEKVEIVDVCKVIDNCDIGGISRYLIKQGKDKKFPDITTRY